MSNYIVGDIQGCYSGLRKLLKKADFDPAHDKLWAVGDLIGRGPESLQTLRFLYSLGDRFETVLGNHDLHLLAIYCGIRLVKPADKLDELLAAKKLPTYIKWLRSKHLAIKLDEHTLLTHAGLYPLWSVDKALSLSAEVSELLSGKHWKSLLQHMYSNEPSCWSKTLQDNPRRRFIINAFTRMRYLENGCELELNCTTSPELAPEGLSPWFTVPNKKLKTKQKVIFGHWASLQGNTHSTQFIALDTGYVWGQSMTLLNLENMLQISS
jgi:bis(5'-nucleosyl)-tetraphosphatase (symmetrical)